MSTVLDGERAGKRRLAGLCPGLMVERGTALVLFPFDEERHFADAFDQAIVRK